MLKAIVQRKKSFPELVKAKMIKKEKQIMITFNNVIFNYSNQPLFTNLNLQIADGEFVFLIGKSGAGKSTLLQMIYMDIFPTEGSVQFDKYNSETMKKKSLPFLRRKLGIVFQDFKLLDDRNVYDNLAFVLRVTGTPRKLVKKKIIGALTDVGLTNKQKNMPICYLNKVL